MAPGTCRGSSKAKTEIKSVRAPANFHPHNVKMNEQRQYQSQYKLNLDLNLDEDLNYTTVNRTWHSWVSLYLFQLTVLLSKPEAGQSIFYYCIYLKSNS